MPPQQNTILSPSSTSETAHLVDCLKGNLPDFNRDAAASDSRPAGIRKPTQLEPLDLSFAAAHSSEARQLTASPPLSSSRSNNTNLTTTTTMPDNKRQPSAAKAANKRARSSSGLAYSGQDQCESDSPSCRLPYTTPDFQANSSAGTASTPASVSRRHDHSESRKAGVSSSLCGSDNNSTIMYHHSQQQQPNRNRKRKDTRKGYTCANCGTSNTPLWRKGNNGQDLCNKCGLYWSRHGDHRPLHQCESSPISSTVASVPAASCSSSSSSSSQLSSRAPSPAVQFEAESPEIPDSTLANTPATAVSSEEDATSSLADEDDAFDLDYTPASVKRARRSSSGHLTNTSTSVSISTTSSASPMSRSNRKNSLTRSPSSASKRQPARRNLMKSLPSRIVSETEHSNLDSIDSSSEELDPATIHHPDLSNAFTGESHTPLSTTTTTTTTKRRSETKRRSQQQQHQQQQQQGSCSSNNNSSPDIVECAQHAIQFLQMQQQNRSQPAIIPQNYVHDRAFSRDWAIVQERTEDLAAGRGISVDYQTLHSIFGNFQTPPMPHFVSAPLPTRPQPFATLPSLPSEPSLVLRLAQLQHQQHQIYQLLQAQQQQQQQQAPTVAMLQSQMQPRLVNNRFQPMMNSFTNAAVTSAAPLSFHLDAENVNYDDILNPSSPTSHFLKLSSEPFSLELNHSPTHQTSCNFDYISPPAPLSDPFETLSQLSDAAPSTPSAYLLCER